MPFAVARKAFPVRAMYSLITKFSMISARVAGVPMPFSFRAPAISSSLTDLPACSINPSNFASVRRGAGFVAFSVDKNSSAPTLTVPVGSFSLSFGKRLSSSESSP